MHVSLLDKFFRGESSEEERARVLRWYLSGQADEVISKKIEAVWQETHQEDEAWGKERIFALIKSQTDAPPARRTPARSIKLRRGHWSYAAVIAILLGATLGTYYLLHPPQATQPPETTISKPQWVVKQTASGEKMTFTLADSSVIKLNAASRLTLNPANPREVFLEGEAFFKVARDSLHPFQIHTGDLITTVLGTSFNINASSAETGVTVSVLTGQVQVRQAQSQSEPTMCLLPGEQARYSRADTLLSKESYAYADVFSWKDGRLYFKNAPFAEVVLTLERWYGVEFEIQRTDTEDGFSGSYTNQSLESVLDGMSFVLQFDYQIEDNKVIIR